MNAIQQQTAPHTAGENAIVLATLAGTFNQMTNFKIKFVRVFSFHHVKFSLPDAC